MQHKIYMPKNCPCWIMLQPALYILIIPLCLICTWLYITVYTVNPWCSCTIHQLFIDRGSLGWNQLFYLHTIGYFHDLAIVLHHGTISLHLSALQWNIFQIILGNPPRVSFSASSSLLQSSASLYSSATHSTHFQQNDWWLPIKESWLKSASL